MKYVVLGGTGMMGRVAVWDLFRTTDADIIIGGMDLEKVHKMADSYRSSRVIGKQIDVRNHAKTAELLKNADIVLNCVQYYYNIDVMKAAIKAEVHYVDLGGLFYVTKEQLELNEQFKKIGKTAILGMGSTPGITNILAAYGAEEFTSIESIEIKVGSEDFSKIRGRPPPVPYSLETLVDEFTMKPAVLKNGKMEFAEPTTGMEEIDFPKPIGKKTAFYTIHSELATFPYSFAKFGLKNASFRVSFDSQFVSNVLFLFDLGLTSQKLIPFKGQRLIPKEFVAKVVSSLSPPKIIKREDYECLRVELLGKKKNKKIKVNVECLAKSFGGFGAGDIDTGTPPSIVAQMLTQGKINEAGVFPPEFNIPIRPFFGELEKRGMKISKYFVG
ncbi:saccharopine dehydrogenase NADP-binding domain-containing protein [Candidatus Micrarchaeota archaeon]|nr:saccharopine dehydrogenase NADP-binding domain-containing protein [Candidatus Micrarchaeota archaeon]